jgi:exonuclease SbcD
LKILHFADAHIGVSGNGRRDPVTDLPVRVIDFLKSLDVIVDAAVSEAVDLVLFCGDAFHHRQPSPTLQREWGRRIMRLSRANIPTVLLVGNHDLSPALNRAHALDGFQTFDVPNVIVVDKPRFLKPADLGGLPLQIIALPYVTRSWLMAARSLSAADPSMIYEQVSDAIRDIIKGWLEDSDPTLPVIMAAHISVQGASYGGFRTMVLGSEAALEPALVRDARFSYVALGHIHKPQDMNEGAQPPVIYPGSIERVDFGEAGEEKYYVTAKIDPGEETQVVWHELPIRPFVDRRVTLESGERVNEILRSALPADDELRDAMVRLVVEYPRELEDLIDEKKLRDSLSMAFEFHFCRKPVAESRTRLPENMISVMSLGDQLAEYLKEIRTNAADTKELMEMANKIMAEDINMSPPQTD